MPGSDFNIDGAKENKIKSAVADLIVITTK